MEKQTFIFAGLFKAATIKAGFDARVVNTLKSSKQLHPDLVSALETDIKGAISGKHADGSMALAAYLAFVGKLAKGDVTVTSMRLLHAVAVASVGVTGGQCPALPDWAVKKEKTTAEKPESTIETQSADALVDAIGYIGKIDNPDTLRQLIDAATARLHHLQHQQVCPATAAKPKRSRRVKSLESA